MKQRRASLFVRSILAVILMIGFYALALGLAGFLILLGWADIQAGRIHLKLLLFILIGAGTILWSILPRVDRFVPPGVKLSPGDHPNLFRLLESVAGRTHQAMPKEVYVIPDVNAWVTERGGMFGIGSRRIMGIGLPTLQALSVSEFEGVLAHEFGHFHGGDTRLGPWIYKTRAALGRTLGAFEGGDSILRFPFRWYASLYLRVTLAVSRWQEYAADRLSATLVGRQALIGGLTKLHRAGAAFGPYWNNEVAPVLSQGHRPPIADGFARFLEAPAIVTATTRILEDAMKSGAANAFDSHPPLAERIAALESFPPQTGASDDRAAICLLDRIEMVEARLLEWMIPQEVRLEPIGWEESGEKTIVPSWRKLSTRFEAVLSAYPPARFPQAVRELDDLGKKLQGAGASPSAPEERKAYARRCLGVVWALDLLEAGWRVQSDPGNPVVMKRGGRTLDPFRLVARLESGELSAEEWERILAESGPNGSGC